jgi:hypothetical protein
MTTTTRKRRNQFISLRPWKNILPSLLKMFQYHRERLEQAKEEQLRTTFGRNSSNYSPYAQTKIEQQEVRVLTMEAMYVTRTKTNVWKS